DRETPRAVAVIVAKPATVTSCGVTGTSTDDWPFGTTTLAGTVATAVLLLIRVTVRGAAAAQVSTMCAFAGTPLQVTCGLTVRLCGTAARTVSIADCDAPPYVPVMMTFVFVLTENVVIGNVAVLFVSVTVTVAGTDAAAGLLLVRLTVTPLGPAGPFSV